MMASQRRLKSTSILPHLLPRGGTSVQSRPGNTETTKNSKRSPTSQKISRSLRQVQLTAENSKLPGHSNDKVEKRKSTQDVEPQDSKQRLQQHSKVQRIVPSRTPVVVFKDPASAVPKLQTPSCPRGKENIPEVGPLERRDTKQKQEGRSEVRNKGHPKVRDAVHRVAKGKHSEVKETQTEVSTITACGECMCACHEKSGISKDGQKKEKTAEEEAWELMGQEEVTPAYWEQLAEQRRQALAEALEENEQLYGEVKKLKEENARLSELADQTDYFAHMLKLATAVAEERAGDADAGSKQQADEENDSSLEKDADSGSQRDSYSCSS